MSKRVMESKASLGLGALVALLGLGVGCSETATGPAGEPAPRAVRAQALGEPRTELTSTGHEAVSGEVLVRFRARADAAAIQRTHALVGAQVRHSFQSVQGLQLIAAPEGRTVEELAEAYRADPDVLYAEPNHVYRIDAAPDDADFDELWGMHNTGQNSGTVDADINAPEAWELTTGSDETVIAVIDTGINYLHEDLADNAWVNPGEIPDNDVDDDGNGYVDDVHGINAITNSGDPLDDHRHGSHCAGTIAGRGNNALGVAGVNWKTKLIGCKFLSATGGGNTANAVKCLDYLLALRTRENHPVNIVASSNSWGGGGFSQALQDGIAAHQQAGILFVAAAGNDNRDNDITANYPSNYPLSNIIAVAATDRKDARASFSNWGRRRVHVGAPGVEIYSSVLGNSYGLLSGTSMATPHVAGLVGLLKAQEPSRDWRALKNLVIAGGTDTAAMAGRTISGKRIRAADTGGKGSLTCENQVVASQLLPVASNLQLLRGARLELSALHINCANPAGDVVVQVTPGDATVTLTDDGLNKDGVAGDGVYTAEWAPPGAGSFTLTFPNGEVVNVTVMDVYRPAQTPAFAWRTITGTSLNLADNGVAQVTAPFPVQYGNHTGFNTAWVSSEGYLSFTDSRSSTSNARMPSTSFQTLVAPYWDSLYVVSTQPGNVFHEVLGTAPNREWVVEWRGVSHTSRRTDAVYPTITFQAVFFEGRPDVLFNYQDVDFRDGTDTYDRGASATVGVQVGPATATQFSYNTRSLNNGQSLLWKINAPPVLSDLVATPASTDEGGSVELSASFVDADGTSDADWTAEYDFDYVGATFTVDATEVLGAEGTTRVTRAFPQSGRYTVGVRVKDRDSGTSAVRTVVVDVANVAPVAAALNATPARQGEGQAIRFTSSFSDVGVNDSPWRVEWNFNYDGTTFKPDITQSLANAGAIATERVFRHDGTFTVAMRVLDKDGGVSALQTVEVTVDDVRPELSALSAPASILEGERFTLGSSFSDPGDGASPWLVQYDFAYDGTTFDVDGEQRYTAPGDVALERAFADHGARVLAVRLVDADGSVSEVRTWSLDVQDVHPLVREAVAAPSTGPEARTVEFRIVADSGSPDAATDPVQYYHWDFDGDGQVDHLSAEPRAVFRYLDNPRGGEVWKATVWVEDEDSRTEQSLDITVGNVAPTLVAVEAQQAAAEGAAFRLQLVARDVAGASDPLTWTLTSAPDGMTVSAGGLLQWVPGFEQTSGGAGAPYVVTVAVSDDDGASATTSFTLRATWKDADQDGMPDTWERAQGLDPTKNDAAADVDGDGVSNLDEALDVNGGARGLGSVRAVAPLEGTQLRAEGVTLVVGNLSVPELPAIGLQVAVYQDAALTQQVLTKLVPRNLAGHTSVAVDGASLRDDTAYWWRARATDGERTGTWSPAQRFFYNPRNGSPGAPETVSPTKGALTVDGWPIFTVLNAKDPEGDALTYDFEVLAEEGGNTVVVSAQGVAEGANGTRFAVQKKLPEGTYSWRARAVDSLGAKGAWSTVSTFVVQHGTSGCSVAAGGGGAFGGLLPLLLLALGLGARRRR